MSLDLVGALVLTLISAIAIGLPALWYVRTRGGQVLLAAHILWFVAVVALAASGALNWRLDLGAPVLVWRLWFRSWSSYSSRRRAGDPNGPRRDPGAGVDRPSRDPHFGIPVLTAVRRRPHRRAIRAGGRMGRRHRRRDAVPVARALASRGASVRWLVMIWNSVGLLDFLAAASLGMTSAPGSPLQVFFDAPGSTAMTALPWALIPVFLVPQLLVGHLAVYWRLRGTAEEFSYGRPEVNARRPA